MNVLIDLSKQIKDKIDSGEASWSKKKDGSPAKKKKKRAMDKGEYRDKDGKICKTSKSDEEAGYPPNCNEGYREKGGECVSIENEEVSKEKEQP